MPIRFQVDPDFYDHPKTIGMSDSATALWVRAGAYSAAKLLDGFVPEDVLNLLSTVPAEAANELVGRGLWRRTKGGFRFHQWAQRNLTRDHVENFRAQERNRKRKQRQNAYTQVDDQIVPPGHPPGLHPGLPVGLRPDSDSVVSVSVSPSTSVRTNPQVVGRGPPKDDRREEINYDELASRLHSLLGVTTAAYAQRVADTALAGANGLIANPVNYVLAAVAREPARYRLTNTPPHVRDLCRHGLVNCHEEECQ